MTSNPPSGTNTPSRFISQAKTTEDLLSTQTVGLVNLSDFRKRRAEAIEQKDREAQEFASGRTTFSSDGTNTPQNDSSTPGSTTGGVGGPGGGNKKKKRKIAAGTPKLSFGNDDEEGEEGGFTTTATASTEATPKSSRSNTPALENNNGLSQKKKGKMVVNSSVGLVPKAITKSALLREAQTRESLRKEFLQIQELVKGTEIDIPFVFYDGTNIPGGVCRIKKGDYVWVFLDRSRKVGADLGVGEKANSRREWARIGVDDLMMVRGNIIIPHHYDFYYFIINHNLGPNNRLLFDYASDPPPRAEPSAVPTNEPYNPLSQPSKSKIAQEKSLAIVEGTDDDPTYTKVVDRRWYERNKHIFPASVWQNFDPEKNYQTEVKRDQGGNAFFFS